MPVAVLPTAALSFAMLGALVLVAGPAAALGISLGGIHVGVLDEGALLDLSIGGQIPPPPAEPVVQLAPVASVRVEPAVAYPGDEVRILVDIDSSSLGISLGQEISCTVTRPNGLVDRPCEISDAASLVSLPGEVERAYPYDAPNVIGAYLVEVAPGAGSGIGTAFDAVQATFAIIPAPQLPASTPTGSPGGSSGGSGPGASDVGGDSASGPSADGPDDGGSAGRGATGASPADDAQSSDDAGSGRSLDDVLAARAHDRMLKRMLVSSAMAGAVLIVIVVGSRWPAFGGMS